MWGSDFPHTDSTWPNSQTVIEKNMTAVDGTTATKLLHDNAARLYHIDV
jgi:predicted TIM-barrel fold metal-dependent hydrolase